MCLLRGSAHWNNRTGSAHLCRSSSFMQITHLFARRKIWITTLWSISSLWAHQYTNVQPKTERIYCKLYIFSVFWVEKICTSLVSVVENLWAGCFIFLLIYFIQFFRMFFLLHQVVYADLNDLLDWLICDHLLNVYVCCVRICLHAYVWTRARV